MCGIPSDMKSSSHKTGQTSLFLLKLLQIQNLEKKVWNELKVKERIYKLTGILYNLGYKACYKFFITVVIFIVRTVIPFNNFRNTRHLVSKIYSFFQF